MQKWSMRLLGCMVVLCSSFLYAKDWKVIRIGVEPSYPPFSMKTPSGKLAGFDIDIAEALCTQLKAKCEFVEASFDGLIESLNVKKFDAIVASLSITEARKKVVNFTDPYYYTPTRLVAKANSLSGATPNLKGVKIGVLRGSVQHWYAREVMERSGTIVVPYTNQNQAFLDLKAGRVEAVLSDVIQAQFSFLKRPEGKGFALVGPVIEAPQYFASGAGIAVRKSDNDLRLALNQALKAIQSNGVYQQIKGKYFTFDISQAK